MAVLLLAVGSAEAATINVSPGESIQAAIDVATTGDEVVVAQGTYVECIDFKSKAITVRSTDPTNPAVVASTIIDGDAGGAVVTFNSGEGSDSVLAGFTITNGSGADDGWGNTRGGGIYCENSSPTISGNTIISNTAYSKGGGICCEGSSPSISGNTISDNQTDWGDGGGIHCQTSSPTISGNTISGNAVWWDGGGIECSFDSSPLISGNTISGNTVGTGWEAGDGGGIYCSDNASPTISDNTISGNSAVEGGGICCPSNVSPSISGNTISGNSASYEGGGISCRDDASPTISGNTIRDNSARRGGGIHCLFNSSSTISGNTISGNTVESSGGGIGCHLGSPAISGNTISDNQTTWGPGGGISCSEGSPTISGNTISGNSAAGDGGGIDCSYNASPTISDNTISGNSADDGGGIGCSNTSSPSISGNTISGNTATDFGGGIGCSYNSSPSISGNTISGNTATDFGGGIYSNNSFPTIAGNTISGNSAQYGGGIGCSNNSSATVLDSIIAFSVSGGGLYVESGTTALVSYCDVYGNTDGDYVGMADPTGANGNISADPLFANAAAGDYHLRSRGGRWDPNGGYWVLDIVQSPCIDGGDPTSDYSSEPAPNGGCVNMGAYGNTTEASKTANRAPTAPAIVAVSPGSPGTEDDLTASAGGATDADGDSVTYEYEWSTATDGGASWAQWESSADLAAALPDRNDTVTGDTLDHRLTVKGEQWKARARAYDGTLYGPWANSDPVTIQDTPPTVPTLVTVDPGSPQTDDDLTALASGTTDPDGDPVTYEYEWCCSTDGGPWGAWGCPGATLPCGETTNRHQWKARACATADGETSGWTESDPVTVGNSAPTLAWVGVAPYLAGGVGPQRGAPVTTQFTFRVKITDADDTAPRRMFVRLQRVEDGGRWRTITTLPLQAVPGTWAGGMICEAKATLPNGAYRHRFYVRDREGAVATGAPADWHLGPRIVAPPQLWTTSLAGRTDDFVHPNTGTADSTRFKFSVLYTDGQGTLAYVHRLEFQRKRPDGTWHNVPARNMRPWAGKPLTGKYYTWQGRLRAGEYRHRLVFEDNDGAATGSDSAGPDGTQWQPGPVVSEATADAIAGSGGAVVTGLAAMPTRAGAQITFSLSAPAEVGARVLNIAGRPIRTLCRAQDSEAGTNTLLWNAQSDQGLPVPNGTYLVEVVAKAGDGAQTRGLAQVRVRR